ncbi:MAG: helix-hairpin-helix domain-containing protein [Clostridia bacterium]|nr:helix-hairpin-helix domain-containing protein [Clostridia bacterium]
MKGFIKEYFNFSKRERNGIIVLILILAIVVTVRVVVNSVEQNKRVDFTEFENDIDKFIAYQTPDFSKAPSRFDPNTADANQLLTLGLSAKTVNGILQYREKGWQFYKPEDLMRVNVITPEEYDHVKDFINIPQKSYTKDYKFQYPEKDYENQEPEFFEFDPNTATKQDLLKLGFLSWQADNIIKYRDKSGVFYSADDLKKIYGLDPDFVDKLIPYINIDTLAIPNSKTSDLKNDNLLFELNKVSEIELQQLNGIGPSYSKRIVAYRQKLGGFVNINQLMEVYGFTDELFEAVKYSFTIDQSLIAKINLNIADFKTLISHPYINKETTNSILNYRKFAGKIETLQELVTQKAIDKETYDKILPYITVE